MGVEAGRRRRRGAPSIAADRARNGVVASAGGSLNLFVYGELRRAEVVRRLLERLPDAEPALLMNHRRHRDEASGYFCAVPVEGARVVGLLLSGLDARELERIDEYEGQGYRRAQVEVLPGARTESRVRAWIYLASERETER